MSRVVYPLAAETVAGMCHWVQNRGGVQGWETHREFHFGYTCPYEAMAAVLRGESDPRKAAEPAVEPPQGAGTPAGPSSDGSDAPASPAGRHDEACEAELILEAGAWSTCRCAHRRLTGEQVPPDHWCTVADGVAARLAAAEDELAAARAELERYRAAVDPWKSETVERLCEVAHNDYERAAAGAGWETQAASRKPWADVPEANKTAMRAAIIGVLAAISAPLFGSADRSAGAL